MAKNKNKELPQDEELKRKEKATDSKEVSNHEEDVSGSDMKRLEDLPGIGPKTAEKLRELGYTLVGVATGRADEISAEMKVSFVVAKGWVQVAQEAILCKMNLKKAEDVDKERIKKQKFYKTGSKTFNELMGGGFGTMKTTGMSGRFSTGKTQSIYDALVDCLRAEIEDEAVYIETEPDTFHLPRIKEIADGRKIKIDTNKLYVAEADQIPTAKAQFLQYKIVQKQLEKGSPIHLVAIDSFTAKFRPGYSRREMLPVRTREFTEHFLLIDYLASKYNIAWVLSCQVIGAPDPGQGLGIKMKTGDAYYPVGGEFLLHSVSTWISLQQVKTELYEAVLYDSSYLPRAKCEFMLTKQGLMDGIR